MRYIAIVLFTAFFLARPLSASEDMPMSVHKLELSLHKKDKVIVEITPLISHYDRGINSLAGLHLIWDQKRISVPQKEIQDITNVQWNTVKILEGAYYGGVQSNAWYRTVEFRFGDRMGRKEDDDYMTAKFHFWGGEYRRLWIDIPCFGEYSRATNSQYFYARWFGTNITARMGTNITELLEKAEASNPLHTTK